jgi:DNA-binding CsgD family transcriptional regulator/tetratricopeptide (TPR) repeat protein
MEAAGVGGAVLRSLAEQTPSARGQGGLDRLDEVVTILLEALSAERPMLVLVEDLHWADAATLDVLRFATRVQRTGHLLLVLSYRTDDVERTHPLRQLLADLDRNPRSQRLSLQRLSAREVRAQAHDILGAVPEPADARRLFERSEGVPFFVEELLALGTTSEAVPSSLREVLLGRYDTLDPAAQQIGRILAAAGERVDHALLSTVSEMTDEQLEPPLRAAMEAGLVVVDPRGYDFRHALVREAVGAELLPGERARFHSRYADALESNPTSEPDRAGRAVRIANHRFDAHDVPRAFEAAVVAMRLSLESFAYATAAQLGERALTLWESVDAAEETAGERRAQLMSRVAFAWRKAGEPARALATLDGALEEADPDDIALRARLLRDRGMLLEIEGRGEAIPELESALALLSDGSQPVLRADVLAELASQYMVSGRGESAIAAATEVLQNAPTEAHRSRSFAANMLGGTRLHQGHIDEGLAHYERARIEADGDVDALLRYHINLSDGLFMLGRHGDAVALAESGLAIAAQAGVERTSGAILALNTLDPLFALGQWERADQLIDRSLDLDPPNSYRVYLRRAKIRSLLWHGDVETALWLWRGWTESLSAVAKWEEQTRSSQALDFADLHLAADDLDTAWEFAGQLLGDPRLGTPAQELPVTATAARIIGRRRRAAGDATLQSDDESRLRAVLDRDVWPTQALWRSLVDAELGGDDGAGSNPALWLTARAVAEAPETPITNRLLVELGLARSFVVAGDRGAAAVTLEELRARAGELGAGLMVGWAQTLIDSAGLGAKPKPLRSDAKDRELTAREQQVLDLVAEGLTNGQIAGSLYLSPKTVAVHVSAILRKLGASTRTEAVRLASSLRPDGGSD